MVSVTEAASFQIKTMMEAEEEEKNLRFGVSGGGCSGLSYTLTFAEGTEEGDESFTSEGISIVVSKNDLPIVKGTVIDFKQSLMGGGFIINNPNAIATCGCGSSFKTKDVTGTPEEC